MPLGDYLAMLKDAGLATLPGTAAEILDDEVRAVICPDKINTEEWLEAHRIAHGVGLRSNVTIMFGTVERPVHVARHLVRTRDLQKETGGFTEFVPPPVRAHGDADLPAGPRPARARRSARCCCCTRSAASRTAGWIDNIQVSWVKMRLGGARQALQAGLQRPRRHADGREHLARRRRAATARSSTRRSFREIVEPLGRPLEQRTTLYGRTQTVGTPAAPARPRPLRSHPMSSR